MGEKSEHVFYFEQHRSLLQGTLSKVRFWRLVMSNKINTPTYTLMMTIVSHESAVIVTECRYLSLFQQWLAMSMSITYIIFLLNLAATICKRLERLKLLLASQPRGRHKHHPNRKVPDNDTVRAQRNSNNIKKNLNTPKYTFKFSIFIK